MSATRGSCCTCCRPPRPASGARACVPVWSMSPHTQRPLCHRIFRPRARNIGPRASDSSGFMLRIFKPKGADSVRNTPGPGQGANALLSGTQERGGSGARPVPLDEVGSRVAVPLHRPKKSREGRGVLTSASSTPPGLHDRPRYHPHSPAPKGAPEATPWGGLLRCLQVNPDSRTVEHGPRG